MELDTTLSPTDLRTLETILWEKPSHALDEQILVRLEGKRYVRREREGWSITYVGHVQFLLHRAAMF